MIYRFGPWELHPAKFELRKKGAVVPIEPLPLRVLIYLIEHRHRVVTRDELLEDVWRGKEVSDWAVAAAIKAARISLEDMSSPRRYVQTLHSKGFRFIVDVLEEVFQHSPSVPRNEGLSLVVMPFDMVSGVDDQAYFSDGLSEDLITDLSQTPGLKVATRNTSHAIKSSPEDRDDIARRLGITHVLEGSVRREGRRVRINLQLLEIKSGLGLWTDRFTSDGDEIFDLQDKLCRSIVASLKLHLSAVSDRRETRNLHAYDRCLRGRSEYYRYAPAAMAKALEYFEEAAELDPNYAVAYAYQSYCRTAMHVFSWPGADETLDPALALARRAVRLNDKSAIAQARLGWVVSYLGEPETCISVFERAMSLADDNAEVMFAFGESLNRLGQPDRALRLLQRAFGTESYVPPSWDFARGHSHVLKRNYSEALEKLSAVMDRLPHFLPARVQLSRLYVEIDQLANAQRVAEGIDSISPGYGLKEAERMFPYPQIKEKRRLAQSLMALGFS